MFNYFGSDGADDPGSNNYMVLRDPAVDALLEGLVQAGDRDSLLRHAHALDRVLQWGYYWIPNYYPPGISTVWWNRFGRPAIAPLYDAGLDTWWEISPSALTQSQMQQQQKEYVHVGL
jgi:microcin C transport system substrate-binding protein